MSPTIPTPHETPPSSDAVTPAEEVASWWRLLARLAVFVIAFTAYGWLIQIMDPGTNWTLLGPLMGAMSTIFYGVRFQLRRRPQQVRSQAVQPPHAWIPIGVGIVTTWGLIFGLGAAISAARHPGMIQFATSVLGAVIGLCVFIAATRLLPTRPNRPADNPSAVINP